MTQALKNLGKIGERVATLHYEKEGYSPLAKNYICLGSELDLIFLKENSLVVVEVKMRQSKEKNLPLKRFLTQKKQEALKTGAFSFLSKNPISYDSICFELCVVFYKKNWNKEILIETLEIYQDLF